MSDQVALHDKLKRAIAFDIDGVSLLALHGGEDRDNSTVVRFVLIDDVTDSKFWHQTFVHEQGFRSLGPTDRTVCATSDSRNRREMIDCPTHRLSEALFGE